MTEQPGPNTLVFDVEAIYRTPLRERQPMIEDFLRAHNGRISSIAAKLIRQFSLRADWRDDCLQTVRVCAWQVLSGPKDPKVPSNNIFGVIAARSRNEVSRLVQSSAYTGVSGNVSSQRRRSAVAQHRIKMVAILGYEPSDEEAIRSYNKRIMASRSNPSRQGALATVEDLAPPAVVHDPDYMLSDRPTNDDGPDPIEVKEVVAKVIDRCESFSEDLGQVARAALGGHLVTPGDFTLSVVDVAAMTGMKRPVVSTCVQQLRAFLIEELDEYGLVPAPQHRPDPDHGRAERDLPEPDPVPAA